MSFSYHGSVEKTGIYIFSLNVVFLLMKKLSRLRYELGNLCNSIATASFGGSWSFYFSLTLFSATSLTSSTTNKTSKGVCCQDF